MSGLEDIGPLTETLVLVRGQRSHEVVIHGVTAEGFFYLMQRFPEMRLLMERRIGDITAERLMEVAAPAAAFVIGCGMIEPLDDMSVTEWQSAVAVQAKAARKFNVSEQLRILTAVFKVTFSEGVGPFVDQLAVLMGVTPVASQKTAENEEQATTSQDTLSASLVGDVPKGPRGARHRASSQHGLNS